MKLDDRIKELIAMGASITANCQPCLQYHISEARKSGADEQAIMEVVEVERWSGGEPQRRWINLRPLSVTPLLQLRTHQVRAVDDLR